MKTTTNDSRWVGAVSIRMLIFYIIKVKKGCKVKDFICLTQKESFRKLHSSRFKPSSPS